jgi:hypothetical protein
MFVLAPVVLIGAALSLAAETQLDHNPSLEEMAQGRDLKSYDDAGEIRELQLLDGAKLAALRAFVWTHWQERKRGYYRFNYVSMDTGSLFFIFIEPKNSGASHVVIRRLDYWVGGGVFRGTLHDMPEVIALQRAKREKKDYGGEYVLVFRAKDGKEVYRF